MARSRGNTALKSDVSVIDQLHKPINYANGSERYRMSYEERERMFADSIQKYWRERGYYGVDISIFDIPHHVKSGTTFYRAARSNLINGLPVGYKECSLGIPVKEIKR